MPMTPSEKQKAYRERHKPKTEPPSKTPSEATQKVGRRIDTPEQVAKLAIVRPEPVSGLSRLARELRRPGDDDEMAERRARISAGARSNYLTGDFVSEIQAMTQHQRDEILKRTPKLRKGE